MGSHQGPEVDALRSALSKAQQAAQERPLKAQLAHADAFIERSRLRIQKLDQEREAETELLYSALQREARLREKIAAEPVPAAHQAPSESGDDLARLRAKVVQLEASFSTSRPVRVSVEASEAVMTRAAKRRVGCEDDAVPTDAQELDEWIGTEMLELRDANDVGDLESVISTGCIAHEDEAVASFSVVEHGGFRDRNSSSVPRVTVDCVIHRSG